MVKGLKAWLSRKFSSKGTGKLTEAELKNIVSLDEGGGNKVVIQMMNKKSQYVGMDTNLVKCFSWPST